ncbi:MAG: PP2C family protein-serine/threonine phosphatase [Kangiellaceae bacterium]
MEQEKVNRCRSAQMTDVGCVRELNEDAISSAPGLWIVADGMGGHACGEVASDLAVKDIASVHAKTQSLTQAIQSAHHRVIAAVHEGLGQSGMGTTVVALESDNDKYKVAWVGDSRAYLWDARNSKLTQVSEDHSLMVRLINAGLLTVEDAKTHPQRHMITQCLGSTEIDDVEVGEYENEWDANQQLILCSDGLSDELEDSAIAEIMQSKKSIEEKTQRLVNSAKQAGGRDNVSVIIIDSPIKKCLSFIERIRALFGG